MTREQQKKFSKIKNAFPKVLQASCKEFGLKKKDYIVWSKKDNLFFTLFLFVSELDGHCYINSTISCKPFWIDELLWDILHMSENKDEPISFRGVGAFTVEGCELEKESHELVEWSVEETTTCVQNAMQNFKVYINKTTQDVFCNRIESNLCHADVRKLLNLIHNKRYDEAIEFASNMDSDTFVNQGLGIRAGAIQYCEHLKGNIS